MDKLKNKNIILIIILVALLTILFILSKKENKTLNDNNNSNYKIVTNANDFFTIEGCINRYIDVLSNKESDNMMKLLDSDYVKKELITNNNVFNKINPLDSIYKFSAKKMYYEKINKDNYKYYVYGKLKKELINGNDLGTDYYVIINMNKEKLLFSVTPYDGLIFKEEM